jgi:hypothetical protein
MKTYIFQTSATMKPYNNRRWWIDSGIVRDMTITAENVREALTQWRESVEEKHGISISDSAIKNKHPMYVDTKDGETKQVGYVITGKTEFEDRDNYKWSTQYIDLWVSIITVVDTEF